MYFIFIQLVKMRRKPRAVKPEVFAFGVLKHYA